MIAILGYLGIHVLKREVIFIDIAVAQIAAVGALGAELAFEAHGHSMLGYACAFGATLVAAAFYSLVRRRVVQIPLEAVIGVSYAIAAAGALFLLGIAPGADCPCPADAGRKHPVGDMDRCDMGCGACSPWSGGASTSSGSPSRAYPRTTKGPLERESTRWAGISSSTPFSVWWSRWRFGSPVWLWCSAS